MIPFPTISYFDVVWHLVFVNCKWYNPTTWPVICLFEKPNQPMFTLDSSVMFFQLECTYLTFELLNLTLACSPTLCIESVYFVTHDLYDGPLVNHSMYVYPLGCFCENLTKFMNMCFSCDELFYRNCHDDPYTNILVSLCDMSLCGLVCNLKLWRLSRLF